MRKIEVDLIQAIKQGRTFRKGNTAFDGTFVSLHANRIAEFEGTRLVAINFCGWSTRTTRSRLSALFCDFNLDVEFSKYKQLVDICAKSGWIDIREIT